MADVSSPDRGQMLVIAGLVLAVMFVGIAMILNGAIYAENLSTQESSGEASDLLEQRSMHAEKIQRSMDQANDLNSTEFDPVDERLNELSDRQGESASSAGARRGQAVDVELGKTTEGNQLRQFESRNFTNKDGKASWTLAEDVTEAGTFEMEFQEEALLDITGSAANQVLDDADDVLLGGLLFHEAFHIEITNSSNGETWRVYIFQSLDADGRNVHLYTQEPGEEILTIEETVDSLLDESCQASFSGDFAEVDIRNGEVGGEPCDDLAFYEEDVVDNEHQISYQNARTEGLSQSAAESLVEDLDDEGLLGELEDVLDLLGLLNIFGSIADDVQELWDDVGLSGDRATGTYDLVVDSGEVDETDFHDFGADDGPRQRTIVYSGQLEMQYRADGASLNATSVDVRWTGAEP